MAQRDFEKFKQEIKSWMEAHPDKYDAFVEEVNGKSFEGIQRVYTLAMRLAPQLMAKARQQVHGGLNRTQPEDSIFTADDTLAPQLVAEFRNTEKSSVVPAVLAWFYYGRCYETMVERLEELINESHSRIYKWICGFMIKFVIRGSIRNKMRTRLASKSGQCDIAMMKVALEEAGITMNCSVRTFRDVLQAEFPEYAIVLERGIQRCYKFLLDTDARTGKLQKDVGEDRIIIDEIVRYFTDAE